MFVFLFRFRKWEFLLVECYLVRWVLLIFIFYFELYVIIKEGIFYIVFIVIGGIIWVLDNDLMNGFFCLIIIFLNKYLKY